MESEGVSAHHALLIGRQVRPNPGQLRGDHRRRQLGVLGVGVGQRVLEGRPAGAVGLQDHGSSRVRFRGRRIRRTGGGRQLGRWATPTPTCGEDHSRETTPKDESPSA